MTENMGIATPTGDFGCLICGSIYGHGNLPCPNTNIGPPQPFQPYQPAPDLALHAKLDRIIEQLEFIAHALREGRCP